MALTLERPVAAGAARPARTGGTGRRLRHRVLLVLPPLVVLLVLVGLWFAVSAALDGQGKGFLVPYPHDVFHQWFLDADRRAALVESTMRTLGVMFTGLSIAVVIGIAWAVVMSQAKWLERSFYPYAVVLQCIPILALVPLIGIWFGFDTNARVVVTVIISIFPIVSNTLFGLQSVDRSQRELFRLQGSGRWTTLFRLQFPAAMPFIFVGLRNAAGLSVIGAIVGDQFFRRGEPGLGVLIYNYASRLQNADLFATILTASLLGVVVFLLFGLLGRLVVGRWYDFA